MEKSTVYFTDFRCPVGTSQLVKLKKLCVAAGIKDIDMDGKFVAIKMHFGELGNLAFLRPNYAKVIADLCKEQGGMPFLTDCGIMEFLGVIAKPVVRPPVPCTWKSVRRPDRILVRCIQCSGNPYQRAVHERLLHKKRSRLHYDKLFPCVHSILPDGCGYHENRKYFPAVLSVHLRGRYHPGSDHRQNPSDPYGAGYLP